MWMFLLIYFVVSSLIFAALVYLVSKEEDITLTEFFQGMGMSYTPLLNLITLWVIFKVYVKPDEVVIFKKRGDTKKEESEQ